MLLIPESVVLALGEILNGDLDVDYKLEVVNGTNKGDNLMSNILRVKAVSINNTNKVQGNTHFICKLATSNEATRKYLNIRNYFLRETIIYRDFLSQSHQIETDKKVPTELTFNFAPRFYTSSDIELEEFLILKDLSIENFKMHDRLQPVTYPIARLALEELAKYHALSFVMRDQRPEAFNRIIDQIRTDNLFEENIPSIIISNAQNYAIKLVEWIKKVPEIENQEETTNNVVKFHYNMKRIMLNAVRGDKINPYAVICHGDFWNNNILYRYDEQNNPVEARLVDFQLARYASPICDISFYLFCCTEGKLREKHFNSLLSIYYKSLTKQIRTMGCNPETLFPRSVFDEQVHQYFIFGFGMSLIAIPHFIAAPQNCINLDAVAEKFGERSSGSDDEMNDCFEEACVLTKTTTPIFKRRLIENLLDMATHDLWEGLDMGSS